MIRLGRKYIDYWLIPFGLFVICILAYGVLAPWLGFYLDDWYIVYNQKLFGAQGFINFFRGDRPLFAYVYMVFVPLFKDSRLGWQLFAVFTHWLAVLSFWVLLRVLMPKQKMLAASAAFFFAVYPGFQCQWFSVMYSQVFLLMSVYILSYIFMVFAVIKEKGKILWLLAAVLCAMVGIIPMEYFYGLELIRPFVLWYAFGISRPPTAQRVRQTVFYWLPFLALFIGFPLLRSTFSRSYSYQINIFSKIFQSHFSVLKDLASQVFWAIFDASLTAWSNLALLFKRSMLSFTSVLMVLFILAGFIIAYLLLKKQTDQEEHGDTQLNGLALAGLGIFASLVAMIPFVVATFDVSLEFPNNRFLLSLAPGASLFLAGIITQFLRTQRQKLVLCSVLIGLAIGSQLLASRSFMLYWNQQKDFFWQLTWRAPQLKPNTALVTRDLNFARYFSGDSLSAPLNLIYAPENRTHTLPYLLLMTSSPQASAISAYKTNTPIHYSFRSLVFTGNTSSIVFFYKPSDGCLLVLSENDIHAEFLEKFFDTPAQSSRISLSNLDRIVTQPDSSRLPPARYFGKEDQNQWCYYFEKASLALQAASYDQVVNLYRRADNAGFAPGSPYEWLPLVEANIRLGQIDKAINITKRIKGLDETNHAGICDLWSRLSKNLDFNAAQIQATDELLSWARCAGR